MEALRGIKQILLFRLLEDATKEVGKKLAFQTEHSVSKSADSDTQQTKDGSITVSSGVEEEISINSIMGKGDPVIELLEDAIDNQKVLELWEVDVTEKIEGKYPAVYRQGYITELNKTANAEDLMELEATYITNGKGQKGEVELSAEQEEIVQYVFRDTEIYIEGA